MTYQDDFNRTLDPERTLYILHNHSNDIDPSDRDNLAIKWASSNNYVEVVKLLLKDKRVDPSDDNNRAIRLASEKGHTEVVKLLEDHIKFGRNNKFYSIILKSI